MFVAGYWSRREESREKAAERIVSFLTTIGSRYETFAKWFKKGGSRRRASKSPLTIDVPTVAAALVVNRRDTDQRPIPELGFRFAAWNGRNASFSASVGAFSEHVGNSVVLSISTDAPEGEVLREVLEQMVQAFDPDHAVVTSHDHLESTGAERPWEAGWFTYERGQDVQRHPF